MTDFLLYGMDEAGQTGFSETLSGCDRAALRTLAEERLRDWHAVEIWEGPMCVVRLRRTAGPND